MSVPLSGMRVVEGSAFVAVPLAGLTLAQMGADVIRFDRLEGGLDAGRLPLAPSGRSLFWAGLNKGKRSIAVDMRAPEGKELITRLITAPGDDAGLFLTNLRVRGWMDYETLSKHRADLIAVTLTGDRHGKPQVDYTVNPALGVPHITGPEDHGAPVASAIPTWDLVAGNMLVSALLAAERHRLRTGQGQDVETSLKDIAAGVIGHLGMIGDAAVNRAPRQKAGNALYGAFGEDFVLACGRRIMVIGLTARQWRGLVKITGQGEVLDALAAHLGVDFDDEGVRWQHRALLRSVFAPWFAMRGLGEIAGPFDAAGLTWSVFRDLKTALADDPDLSDDNPMFTTQSQPGLGTFPVPGSPLNFSEHARQAPGTAPVLGEHTEEILGDTMGLTDTEVSGLFDRGVVQSPGFARQRPAA